MGPAGPMPAIVINWMAAMVRGLERLCAWSDLLDRINVYPVADGDTGRNLTVSLAPLRQAGSSPERMAQSLLLAGRGNSGNIASRFLSALLAVETRDDLPAAVREGRSRAWQAVHDPRPGTMLSVFDTLTERLNGPPPAGDRAWTESLIDELACTVRETMNRIPRLQRAGVVDAGALGMFLFLEGCFRGLEDGEGDLRSVVDRFPGQLRIRPEFREAEEDGYCVDFVLRGDDRTETAVRAWTRQESSVVFIREKDVLKLHFHTRDPREVRQKLSPLGKVVRWTADDLGAQTRGFRREAESGIVHVMTDAAGSVTRADAREWGITLLDSYITLGDRSLPETHFDPEDLYREMREGIRATTSQASLFERHQRYQSVLSLYPQVLYLCVGSVYTGNFRVAREWREGHDPGEKMRILDTGSASGRLAAIVLATARFARQAASAEDVFCFARTAMGRSEEYIFVDTLQYLAAGGRLSRTSAFFGDMLHMKPVISPTPQGAQKIGVVRNRSEQLRFALERMDRTLHSEMQALILLEYTDTRQWLEEAVLPEVSRRYPQAEILVRPASLTSGVHFGPGSWAVAFLPPP